MRKCSRCGKKKSLENFNFKNKAKNLRQYHCKDCSRLYVRTHYYKNKAYYLKKAYKRNHRIRNEIRTYIWAYLNKHSCVDCGEKDPTVLEFDHISDKIIEVSRMNRNYSLNRVKEEILKCEVRCANCHRKKTALQLGWHKKLNLLP